MALSREGLAGIWEQFLCLLDRNYYGLLRDPLYLKPRIFSTTFTALLIVAIFHDLNGSSFKDKMGLAGCLFFVTTSVTMNGFSQQWWLSKGKDLSFWGNKLTRCTLSLPTTWQRWSLSCQCSLFSLWSLRSSSTSRSAQPSLPASSSSFIWLCSWWVKLRLLWGTLCLLPSKTRKLLSSYPHL